MGRNGTERDGADTVSDSNGTNAGGNSNAGRTTGTYAVIFCHCFSTFIFSSFRSSSFLIISFPTSKTTGGARKESAGRTGRRRRGQRVRLLLCVCSFDSPLLFLSFFFFSNDLFSAEYNNRRPGRSGDGNAGRDAGGQAGTTGTSSSVTVFLSTLLFSSSHFYYLFCRKLQQQTGRGRVGSGRTGQRGRR